MITIGHKIVTSLFVIKQETNSNKRWQRAVLTDAKSTDINNRAWVELQQWSPPSKRRRKSAEEKRKQDKRKYCRHPIEMTRLMAPKGFHLPFSKKTSAFHCVRLQSGVRGVVGLRELVCTYTQLNINSTGANSFAGIKRIEQQNLLSWCSENQWDQRSMRLFQGTYSSR